jgi:hypothetical protein
MPWVEFEPTIPVFERSKIFYALDRGATVIGQGIIYKYAFMIVPSFREEKFCVVPSCDFNKFRSATSETVLLNSGQI